ncbi:MAG: ferrous iron transport protein B [Chitinophagia bacterium]|nr:ferrous iron transport protein B [Chitinophagia bacterium]
MSRNPHIVLIGNPNSGKSSVFNHLTGLRQKIGNFPGVTVEKKSGVFQFSNKEKATVIDLPGAYSLYPRRSDEWVSYKQLMSPAAGEGVDIAIVVVDATALRRNLLFVSQVIDLKIPVVVALTMMDIAKKRGIRVNIDQLSREMQVPVVPVNARSGKGVDELKSTVFQVLGNPVAPKDFFPVGSLAENAVVEMQELFPTMSAYSSIHHLINHENFELNSVDQEKIEKIEEKFNVNHTKIQAEDIQQRYKRIRDIVNKSVEEDSVEEKKLFSEKLDSFFLHRTWGYLIMGVVLFLLFQSVFWAAEYPMNAIEQGIGALSGYLGGVLEKTWYADLFINGVLAGLSGILVFVPQIMILFGLITLLEDTGYMARISFLTDRIMRRVGLNGKSVMPMIGGFACAVPAIMSARNIENKKERLLTILVTPFMSCSARLPVFTILAALVVPNKKILGVLSLQGLVLMGLYVFGVLIAMFVSYLLNLFIKIKEKSFFILELPLYKQPRWNNIIVTMFDKAKVFVFDAGKVIMVISLLLWGLSSFGPGEKRDQINRTYTERIKNTPSLTESLEKERAASLLEYSYAGILGRSIEPVIRPLGYDWKIGIALITSFAAREVFVGTMATLYSVGESEDSSGNTLTKKMESAKRPDGSLVYSTATGFSLLIFYLLAMQCMSTLAVVKRETGSWKWPLIQLLYMTGLAYLLSFITYQLLS